MIFHENRLPADDSHEISYLIFLLILGRMSQNLSSAAVVIGALRVNYSLFLIGEQSMVPLEYRNLDDLVWGPSV